MRLEQKALSFSPTDLVRYFESEFASFMDHFEKVILKEVAKNMEVHRDPKDPLYELIANLGNIHEKDILSKLSKTSNIVIIDRDNKSNDECLADTIKAMATGAEIIYQAALESPPFFGFADLLVKKSGESKLGKHYYIPQDIKISSHPKPNAIVQLCCYSDLLSDHQGTLPDTIIVVTKDGQNHEFKTSSFFSYYRYLKLHFLAYHQKFNPEILPIPDKTSDHKDWTFFGKKQLHKLDDVSLTARIRSNHIDILRTKENIQTITDLSTTKKEVIKGIPASTFEILVEQAKLQIESRNKERPTFKVLKHAGKREGLELLPPPNASDVFFDMEGYPLLGKDGLEYLYGNIIEDEYTGIWAYNDKQEASAFNKWVQWVFKLWQKNPAMHIYHYGHYETSTVKRLMGKYGICEKEVDTLLRNGVFVDLNRVLTQGIRVGTHSYSLKVIEKLYYPSRQTRVTSGGEAAVHFFHFLNSDETPIKSKFLKAIAEYNLDDCKSTRDLAQFLRKIQKENRVKYLPFTDSPPGEQTERKGIRGECEKKAKDLFSSVPPDERGLGLGETTEHHYIAELMAHLLEFHIREDKPGWWDYFSRFEMGLQEKYEDRYTIADCQCTKNKGLEWHIIFEPEQIVQFEEGDKVLILENKNSFESYPIHSIDLINGQMVLKCTKPGTPPTGIFTLAPEKSDFYKNNLLKSLLKTAGEFSARKPTFGLRKCIYDLLLRKQPEITGHKGKLISSEEKLIEEASNHALNMNETVLCIQGPPGAGKTYTAAHMILNLISKGKRVGVTANSHKAILNVLRKVSDEKKREPLQGQKVGRDETFDDEVETLKDTDIEVVDAKKISKSANLVGATTFFFSRSEQENCYDYLFVDEASQVSLANMIAAARSTRNLVLIGDQNQLDQPLQGTHPGESGKSALSYYIGDEITVSEEKGIFLPTTHRMNPKICNFISDNFYNGKLHPHKKTKNQRLKLIASLKKLIPEEGVVFLPVNHRGNMNSSSEEVEIVAALYGDLLKSNWINNQGKERLTRDDILIVSPYNLQVAKLKKVLGEKTRVASVDKFQGQEAPITILSMAASTIQDAPRGISFLLNKNRLNVAISRAKCLSIVVGSSNIITPRLSSLLNIELMNIWAQMIESKY